MAEKEIKQDTPDKINMARRIRNYFFTGILVTAPAAITIYLAVIFISYIDSNVVNLLPAKYNPETYLPYGIPGIGLVILFVFFVVVGWFATGLVGGFFVKVWEKVLASTPIISSIYNALKQIFETFFSSSSKHSFREVVLIEYPRKGLWTIAFITGSPTSDIKDIAQQNNMTSVYVPTTPNPTSGFLLFVPNEDVHKLDMSVEDGLKYVISVGIVAPTDKEAKALLKAEMAVKTTAKKALENSKNN